MPRHRLRRAKTFAGTTALPADVVVWTMPLKTGSYLDEPPIRDGSDWSLTRSLPHDVRTSPAR